MRRIVVLLIGCVAILAMSGNVSAESFNDRGVDWIMAAPEGSSQPRLSVRPRLAGFNDRSVDWVTAVLEGTNRPYFAIVLHHH